MKIYDGAIGPTRLGDAQAHASIGAAQCLDFDMDLAPLGPASAGRVKVGGCIPLNSALQVWSFQHHFGLSALFSLEVELTPGPSSQQGSIDGRKVGPGVDVRMDVKDDGMMLISSLIPDFRWQHGSADISLRCAAYEVSGRFTMPDIGLMGLVLWPVAKVIFRVGRVRREADLEPVVQGKAEISKAAIICPYLKYPVTNAEALIRLENDSIWVDVLEVARRYHLFFGVPSAIAQWRLKLHDNAWTNPSD